MSKPVYVLTVIAELLSAAARLGAKLLKTWGFSMGFGSGSGCEDNAISLSQTHTTENTHQMQMITIKILFL